VTKRPPEMVELHRHALLNGSGLVEFSNGHWTASGPALAAIRSLRVKLFRERALRYERRGIDPINFFLGDRWVMVPYDTAAAEFRRIADAIERGER
jgi:hypothetical protein